MKNTTQTSLVSLALISLLALNGCVSHNATLNANVPVSVIAEQRAKLAESIIGKDVGAQAPRDIDLKTGLNTKKTRHAPAASKMYLCDIHFHKSTEHKGGEFTKYAGNGNGEGFGTGYKYNGTLTKAELAPYEIETEENPLYSGDTIEVHYVYSSNPHATLEHGLGSCLTDWTGAEQPLLRVEAQVYVLVNDENALDFTALNHVSDVNGHNQAEHIPHDTGTPVEYEGSTTGPGYNEKPSPYQVSWSVRPKVAKVNIKTVEKWFHHNQFGEHHAHGVRNLVVNPDLLSSMD